MTLTIVDLKQTNFIDRLVEDTLAADEVAFQPTAPQIEEKKRLFREEEDTSSQFSHLNESLDRSSQQETQAESVEQQKQQKAYEQSQQQAAYIEQQKKKFDVDKLKEEKEKEIQ